MALVTCHTEGCPSAGVTIDLNCTWTDADTGQTFPVDEVLCGACGQEITDIAGDGPARAAGPGSSGIQPQPRPADPPPPITREMT